MRWFVNINGRTTGPVEEEDLAQMVREGLVANAHIRDESGGAWVDLATSPFARFLPKPASRVPAVSAAPAPAKKAVRAVSMPPAVDPDDPFDHPLHLDGSIPPPASLPPPAMSAGMRAPGSLAPARMIPGSMAPAAPAAEPSNLFDRQLLLDEAPSVPPPKMNKPAEQAARRLHSVPPIEEKETSNLFKKGDLDDFDLGGVLDAALEKHGAADQSMARPSVGPTITLGHYTDFPEADIAPEPVRKPKREQQPIASATAGNLAAALEGDSDHPEAPDSESEPDAAPESTATPAQGARVAELKDKLRHWWLSNKKRTLMVAGVVILLGGMYQVGGKALIERRQRDRQAAEHAAAEAKQQALRAEQKAVEDKKNEAQWALRAAEGRVKATAWLSEIATAAEITELELVPKQLARIVAIQTEAEALAGACGPRVPAELANVVIAAKAARTGLQNATKVHDAKAAAMDWLRQIRESSLTTKLVQIPIEIEKVQAIQKKATALVTDLGEQVPLELSSVMPAATTALGLLGDAKKILEATDAARKELERGDALVENRDWIAADKAYQNALAAVDKVELTGPKPTEEVPPELNLASEQSLIVNSRKRIASAVAVELKRLELEQKQREQEEETQRKAAAYRARCGSAPAVSPFDGQLFGLEDAMKKAAHGEPGRFNINHCSDPVMTKTDCWVSTCAVDGKMFGSDFRRKFSFAEREGFKQLK